MNLRPWLLLPINNRLQMRLETCSWTSVSVSRLRKHVVPSNQVFCSSSQHKSGAGNPVRQQSVFDNRRKNAPDFPQSIRTAADNGDLGSRGAAKLSTVAFHDAQDSRDSSGVHLSPKPQRIEKAGAPPLANRPQLPPRPQRPLDNHSQLSPRTLALRDRLQIARRKRVQEYKQSAAIPATPTTSFDLIVSNRLATNPPAPATLSPTKEKDSFSPLVKAIFDLLDQPVIEQQQPSVLPSATKPFVQKDTDPQEAYYHRQRHKYNVYVQAFNTGNPRFDSLGRTLCRILRHQATSLGIKVRSNGYVKVDDILSLGIRTHAGIPMNQHSVGEVLEVVERDPKQRYSTMIEDGELYVRANQGHSMKAVVSEHLLTEITAAEQVPFCVHGTFKCFLPSIMRSGLKRMSRNHVHFAVGLPTDEGVISGMMDTVEVLIYLNVAKALEDGMKLYISDNKVLLTEGFAGVVPCEYFERVVEWPSFAVLAWN